MKGNFQIILIVIFILGAVFGVLVFSGKVPIGGNSNGPVSTVVLWGTASATDMIPIISNFNTANKTFTVKYVQKSSDTLDKDLLEALASGVGPDLFFLPDNLVYSYRNKITPIPYTSYPLAAFKGAFLNAGDVFLSSKGIIAFPVTLDPLVMYYNRNMLDAAGIVYPPAYWSDLLVDVPLLNQKDDAKKISKSAVALGQFSNVTHAKEILSALFMQTNNNIVGEQDGSFISILNKDNIKNHPESVLGFYTNFADPLQALYSWNKSLPDSIDSFTREDLAFYFGFGSELSSMIKRNPNQNFLVASFPQVKGASFKSTFARTTGIAISSFSKNFVAAFTAASLMSTGSFAKDYATATGTIPVRRDLIASAKPSDAYTPAFYTSALYARSWLDPKPSATSDIFRKMVDNVLSNAMTTTESIEDADLKLDALLNSTQ